MWASGLNIRLQLLLCLLLFGSSGCAVNGSGLVKVRHYENDTAYVVSWEVWGGHVITNAMDAGVTLGYSQRTYIYPKFAAHQGSGEGSLVLPFRLSGHEVTEVTEERTEAPPALGDMVALARQVIGASLAFNRAGVGVSLGMQTREMMWLPCDFEGTVLLKHSLGNDDKTEIYVTGGGQ